MKIKKTLSKLSVVVLLAATACFGDPSKYGKIQTYKAQAGEDGSFTFYVDEEYLSSHEKSKIDKKYPQMTKAESSLLKRLLRKEEYCAKNGFVITSRQEKIYDVTFAHLIEQNYRAKPVAPRMYYGKCL